MNDIERAMLREKYRRRNYFAWCCEAFFGSFGITMFSFMTVMPGYVSTLTSKAIFISLLTVIIYAGTNGLMVLSCTLAVNLKTIKPTYVLTVISIRLGLFGILVSSFLIQNGTGGALAVAMLGFSIFSAAVGISNPLYAALVSRTMIRSLSSFYGTYLFINAFAGVLASQVIRLVMNSFSYPNNYRVLFTIGFFTALLTVVAITAIMREVPDEKEPAKLRFKNLPKTAAQFFAIKNYRSYLTVRVFAAIGEMAIPFYIVAATQLPGATPGAIGTLSMVMLISQAIFSKVWGALGERVGPVTVLFINGAIGVVTILFALNIKSINMAYIMFVLVGILINGVNITLSLASIKYAKANMMPIMNSVSGLIIAPTVMVFSLIGGALSQKYGINFIFAVAGAGFFALTIVAAFKLVRAYKDDKSFI